MRWIINGALEWQTTGLRPPACVEAATSDYFDSQDGFARWLEERTTREPNASTPKAALFADWKTWAEACGEYVGNERRLAEQVLRLDGVDETRVGKGRTRTWIGIGLRGKA